jgi:hypothetical protein
VVADAVEIEPVSFPEFPVSREISRQFSQKWHPWRISGPKMIDTSIAYRKIPCSKEQGIFNAE